MDKILEKAAESDNPQATIEQETGEYRDNVPEGPLEQRTALKNFPKTSRPAPFTIKG